MLKIYRFFRIFIKGKAIRKCSQSCSYIIDVTQITLTLTFKIVTHTKDCIQNAAIISDYIATYEDLRL